MPCEKIKRITRLEISANHPNKRYQDALKCYRAAHNNG
jgi:hypothetical protein